MKIDNNVNTMNRQQTAFTAIKSIKYEGLYKKFPEHNLELLSALKKNETAINFFKKYDVNIVFHALKDGMDAVTSSIFVFYKNPSKSKLAKFFNFLGNNEDKVHITAYDRSWSNNGNNRLTSATNKLIENILPETPGRNTTGILSSHLNSADKRIQEASIKKAGKISTKVEKAEKAQADYAKTTDAINDFIKSVNE